jgi:hypothetical protein
MTARPEAEAIHSPRSMLGPLGIKFPNRHVAFTRPAGAVLEADKPMALDARRAASTAAEGQASKNPRNRRWMRVGRDGPKQNKMEAEGGKPGLGFHRRLKRAEQRRAFPVACSPHWPRVAVRRLGGAPRQPGASAAEGFASVPRGTRRGDPRGSWKEGIECNGSDCVAAAKA